MSDTNLLTMPWIPVLRTNGKCERVGIRKALTEAGSIRQIAASNPMEAAGGGGSLRFSPCEYNLGHSS